MAALTAHVPSPAVAAAKPTLALLPVGACEQHGPHLPLDTDSFVVTAVARQVGERVPALVLPTVAYGTSWEHHGYPGTMTLRPQTLAGVVTDLVDSCVRSGIARVAILSGHGGNWILPPTVRDINARHTDRTAVVVPGFVMWPPTIEGDLHAGGVETAVLLHLDPGAVGTPPADFVPDHPREVLDVLGLREITPDGVWGRPSQASAALGASVVARMVDRVADYLLTTFDALCTAREAALS